MRRGLKLTFAIVIVCLVLYLIQRLFIPKYVDGIVEGAFISEYYDEKKDHDVIFVGDCEVYENFSPMTLWDEYGINSYIRGSAEQYIWQSYYILEDTLRYEKPKVVVFNIQSLQFSEGQNEAYNRMSLEGLPWSLTKVNAIKDSMSEEESFIDYVFPILRYHSRWKELTLDDVKYMFNAPKVSHNGYYMRVDVLPAENVPEPRKLSDYSFGDRAWSYLDRMRELCEKNNIKLVLIKAPSLYPTWYDQWEEQVEDYANKYELTYINFLELTNEAGLNYDTDTYDAGLHLNLSGAEKMAKYFGKYLRDECEIRDRRDEKDLSESWDTKRDAYNKGIQAQLDAMNEKEQ